MIHLKFGSPLIRSCVNVSIMLKPTMPTLELLSVPIRLPFFRVNVSATRTRLTGVGRGNENNQHASDSRFVPNKDSELVKRPVVGSTSLCFAPWFGVEAIPNSGQVLKSQCRTRLVSLSYQLLPEVVGHPFLKPTCSA